jgi:hypothetical protein
MYREFKLLFSFLMVTLSCFAQTDSKDKHVPDTAVTKHEFRYTNPITRDIHRRWVMNRCILKTEDFILKALHGRNR